MKITPKRMRPFPTRLALPDFQEPESGAQDSNFKEQNPEVITPVYSQHICQDY